MIRLWPWNLKRTRSVIGKCDQIPFFLLLSLSPLRRFLFCPHSTTSIRKAILGMFKVNELKNCVAHNYLPHYRPLTTSFISRSFSFVLPIISIAMFHIRNFLSVFICGNFILFVRTWITSPEDMSHFPKKKMKKKTERKSSDKHKVHYLEVNFWSMFNKVNATDSHLMNRNKK